MSEVSFTKYHQDQCAMESCYKLYMWLNHTVFMLLLQIVWKIRQISDYFNEKSVEDIKPLRTVIDLTPLTKESKLRRHIRSMSDVQSSTPYYLTYRNHRKHSYHALMYDSDTRIRRTRAHCRHSYWDSSDSSDFAETPKFRAIERKITKPADSMRFL